MFQTQKIHVLLEPPAAEVLKEASADLPKMELANTIVALRRELQKGLSEPPKLWPKTIDIEISFGAQRSGGGGAEINLVFVQLGGSGEYSSECVHKIILHFLSRRLPG